MFVIVFSLLVLHSVIGSPIAEEDPLENREFLPSRQSHGRDFDRFFDWMSSPWYGSEGSKKVVPIKERVRILETRQKVLFDLVRCHSYGQSDCTPFRTQAETVFEAPSKEEQNLTPPTKVITPAAATTPVASTAAAVPTTAAPTSAAPVPTSAAPTPQPSTTAAVPTPSAEVTAADDVVPQA